MKLDTYTVGLCVLLLVAILCLGRAVAPTVTEGMADAESEKKQFDTIKKQWVEAVLPLVIEASEKNLHKLRFILPVEVPEISAGIKKYWAMQKQMMGLAITQHMFAFTDQAGKGAGNRIFHTTDASRKDMETAVLLGNAIKAVDAAMAELGASPTIGPAPGSGAAAEFGSTPEKAEGGWF